MSKGISKQIQDKLSLIEEVINLPTFLLRNKNYHWKNLPMVSYSNLKGAISSIVEKGRKVLIITGFYIPSGNPPATETDGPPGALTLAEGLKYLGIEVYLLSDRFTIPTLKAGLDILKISEKEIPLICFPLDEQGENHEVSFQFARKFFNGPMGKDLTHLIYIERVGPNHTLESFLSQERDGKPPINDFNSTLIPSMRDRCFSSRLEDITSYTAKTHILLEIQRALHLQIESIGVADRGNEIGAGRIPWEVFKKNSTPNHEAIFCCRVKTDYLVSCGISNWGGYALLAGVALLKDRLDILKKVTPEQEGMVLEYLVSHGPAIDGITCRQEHSVDGIEFKDYIKVIEQVMDIAMR